ncbi:MAG: UvrB/UvrC motif-containing protein [Candidatus Omnitrophota bacterium]
MLCDICQKNEASVHLTEVINGEVTEMHLCDDCARGKGAEMQQHFGIADLLSGLVDFPLPAPSVKKESIKLKCPNCGMTYSDFKGLGKFGCARCYDTFKRALYPLFKRIHGTARHTGKEPVKLVAAPITAKENLKKAVSEKESLIIELDMLKSRIAKAIEKEDFEGAAVLRDKIRAIEKKMKN